MEKIIKQGFVGGFFFSKKQNYYVILCTQTTRTVQLTQGGTGY